MAHEIDGTLSHWKDLEPQCEWKSLLVGNGLSMNLWPGFRYASLFDRACDAGHLDETDQALFEALDTENFERVLSAVSTAVLVADVLGDPTDHLLERYESVKAALGKAVRDVHPELADIDRAVREEVRAVLRQYETVFTTSYDLLVYWCSGAGEDGDETFDGFKDRFWGHGRREFDPKDAAINEHSSTRLLYLHGALHLVVNGAGVTRKRTSGAGTLLSQFAKRDSSDPTARPLLITEGEAADKHRAIRENYYLSFALRTLRGRRRPLVVFGQGLSDQDSHLVSALNRHPDRPTAVGIVDRGQIANRTRQADLRRLLEADELFFFDSATHPLGAKHLTADVN